jgi:HSP20 family protein
MNSLVKRTAIDRIFDDFFGLGGWGSDLVRGENVVTYTYGYPRQKKIEGGVQMSWDLPGVKKEDLKIDVEKNILKISAKRYDLDEQFTSTYKLSEIYDRESADAQLSDGILTITFKEREDAKPKRLTVSVK